MHYTEYFTLRDCSGFLQIRSHITKYANENFLPIIINLKSNGLGLHQNFMGDFMGKDYWEA